VRFRVWTIVLFAPVVGIFLTASLVSAVERNVPRNTNDDVVPRQEAAQAIASVIDRHIAAKWNEKQLTPAVEVDDAAFARRVYLDLIGRIPRVGELREFLEDQRDDKRERLVAELLDSAAFSFHFANTLRKAWIPEGNTQQGRQIASEFDIWLHKRLSMGDGYDDIVREVLTVPLKPRGTGPYALYNSGEEPKPTAFYALKEIKAENLAAATARSFLGVRVECAQCHDHPVADWSQEDFWQFAAFFGGIQRSDNSPFGAIAELFRKNDGNWKIEIPDKNKTVEATFLDGTAPSKDAMSPRMAVADWLLGPAKQRFARATVNRLWAHQFGMGLVDPVDDMDSYNDPSHPELLEELATLFIDSDYDIRVLLHGISMSRPYRLTSATTDSQDAPAELYIRRRPKAMSIQQILASVNVVSGGPAAQPALRYYAVNQIESVFEEGTQRAIDRPTTLLQALAMMNGQVANQINSSPFSQVLTSLGPIEKLPNTGDDEWIDTVFLAILSRTPSDTERTRVKEHLKVDEKKRNVAVRDLLWAMVNTSEFRTNH
jgi:hypothetical protein